MIPPYFQRGVTISVDKLNQMIDLIRQALIQPGPGYSFNRNWGGTTLNIEPQTTGGSSGAGTECRWQLSQTGNMTIQIANAALNGQYPDGMSQDGIYELTIPSDQDWHAIYLVMVVDDTGNVESSPTGLTFSIENDYKKNEQNTHYFLVGEVVSSEMEGARKITYLHSECPFPFPAGGGGGGGICFFRVTDISPTGEDGKLINTIEVAYGLVQNIAPSGMILGTPYTIAIGNEPCYLWMKLTYATDTTKFESCEIEHSTDLKVNTDTIEYVLIATIDASATGGPDNGPYIKSITQSCAEIVPNPCNLDFTTVT